MATEVNMSKLKSLVKRGKSLPEAANELGQPASVVGPHFYRAEVEVDPSLKMPATGKSVKTLRDKEGLRWERIAARTGMSTGAAKQMYEDAGGDLDTSWTGRGRKPGNGATAPAKKSAAAKKTTPAKRGRPAGSKSKSAGTQRRARTRAERAAKSGNPS